MASTAKSKKRPIKNTQVLYLRIPQDIHDGLVKQAELNAVTITEAARTILIDKLRKKRSA